MRKNIWIINHYASEMYRSGGGRHHWFARELQKKGYNVLIVCSNVYYTSSTEKIPVDRNGIKLLERDGVEYAFVDTSTYERNDLRRVRNILDFYFNVQKKQKQIQQILKPDVIVASSVHPLTCVAGIKIAKKIGVPCIAEIRDLWPDELIRDDGMNENGLPAKMLFRIEHWIYKKADAIIFTQEGGRDYIRDRKWDLESGGSIDLNKVYYINNGVCLEEFDKNLQIYKVDDPDLSDDSFKVIYAGAIRQTNGIDRLLDIGKKLSDYPQIKLLIWGDGDQVPHIKQRIEDEAIHNVYYKGRVEKKYIPYILSRSNINILNYKSGNSFYYGCSNNKFFEYLAAGKPILCTVKMNYSIIDAYNCGIETENDQEILNEIIKLYQGGVDAKKEVEKNVRNAAYEFDFCNHTVKLIEIIKNVCLEGVSSK